MNALDRTVTVGLNACVVADDPNTLLVTFALGSCIAVTAWDPILRVGGMIHYSLPLSSINASKAADNPTMFGDTGIPILFRSLYELGAQKRNLVVCVVGGARLSSTTPGGVMDVGRRNYIILRRLFWKNNVPIATEDVGGARSRTVKLWIRDGVVTVSSKGVEEVLFSSNPPKGGPNRRGEHGI